MRPYGYILLLLIVPAMLLGLWLCFKLGVLDSRLDRSQAEVADMLRSFMTGTTDAHAVDDFECIPIKDTRLDSVRERFGRLAEEFPRWNGDGPFPIEGQPRLQSLIDEAESAS